MSSSKKKPCRRFMIVGALVALVAAPPTEAAESAGFSHSSVRLLKGDFSHEGWSAGVEIVLSDGWKTYWRMPGESGVPPVFDWSGSTNVAEVTVSWPAPGRYHDAAGETIGYAERVVFPLAVRPATTGAPVELVLDLHYAVCKDICVPARAQVSRVLDEPGASDESRLIRRFADQVPTANAAGLDIGGVRVEEAEDAPYLAVILAGRALGPSADIFVEGFDEAYFRAPRRMGSDRDGAVFHLPIDGLSEVSALRGRELTLTVVTATARLVRTITVQ